MRRLGLVCAWLVLPNAIDPQSFFPYAFAGKLRCLVLMSTWYAVCVPAPQCAGSPLLKEMHGFEPPAGTMRHASRGAVHEEIL